MALLVCKQRLHFGCMNEPVVRSLLHTVWELEAEFPHLTITQFHD